MSRRKYAEYLESETWVQRRDSYWARHQRVCRGCGSTATQLHHHTYDRLGNEPDDDLVPLCRDCHSLIHRYYSLGGKNLSVCTHEVIAYLNNLPLPRPARVKGRIDLARSSMVPGTGR